VLIRFAIGRCDRRLDAVNLALGLTLIAGSAVNAGSMPRYAGAGRPPDAGHERLAPAGRGTSNRSVIRRGRRHNADGDQFQAEAADPLHEPVQGALIRELSTKRGGGRAHADFAVVEFCPQDGTRLARESDLIRSWMHHGYASQSGISCAANVPGAPACVITL
jgi:hypothetical protein